jgi:imidazolonepropionase-like amidohydrolase
MLWDIFKNRMKPSTIISISIVTIFLMYTSPKMYLGSANATQPIFSVIPNQILTKNNTGIIILENATVIDGTGALPEPNTTIVINGSRIMYVASNTTANNLEVHRSPAKNVINLTSKYVIPGLFDMHAHVANVLKNSYNESESEHMLCTLLAYGVTTIRNPGGPTEQSVALREYVSKGKIAGPQIFTAGRLLNTPEIQIPFVEKQVQTEQEVRHEVRNQVATGVDYVKLYVALTPDLVKAAIDEAHSNGKEAVGHLYLTSWIDAANLGIDALTHGIPVNLSLLSKENQQKFLEGGNHPFNHFLWLDLVDLDGPEMNQMIKALVSNNIPVDPTLNVYESIIKEEPDYQYLWPKVKQLSKMLYESGVTILSGTDIPNFDLVPGASLHHELEILAEAGIPPLEVIKIASNNGATALGIENDVGTIEPGKQADIVVLSDNPMDDISNTKKIEAVINNGQFVNGHNCINK